MKTQYSVLLAWMLLPLTALADTRVLPEEVLAEWGYYTTQLEPHQTIRQIESLPDREQPMHPRFDIWSEAVLPRCDVSQHVTQGGGVGV